MPFDTPPILRGLQYPTHLTARCSNFDPCVMCHACTKYDPHNLICVNCESRKLPGTICIHTDKQQSIIVDMNTRARQIMFSPDQQSQSGEKFSVAYDTKWEDTMEELRHSRYGNIAPEVTTTPDV